MFKLKEENSLEVLKECYEMCQKHFYELGDSHGFQPFNVDWGTLKTLLNANLISVLVARKDGVVVGYFMNVLNVDFMTSTLVAKELAIYVDEAYRGGRLFYKMVKEVESLLKSKGVVTQYITFVHGHNDKMPLKLGFTPLEITYKKELHNGSSN